MYVTLYTAVLYSREHLYQLILIFFDVLLPFLQERKKMPEPREEDGGVPGESSTSICKMAAFYRRFKIEFHISGMVFCLIGGKVRGLPPFFRGIMGREQYCLNLMKYFGGGVRAPGMQVPYTLVFFSLANGIQFFFSLANKDWAKCRF